MYLYIVYVSVWLQVLLNVSSLFTTNTDQVYGVQKYVYGFTDNSCFSAYYMPLQPREHRHFRTISTSFMYFVPSLQIMATRFWRYRLGSQQSVPHEPLHVNCLIGRRERQP